MERFEKLFGHLLLFVYHCFDRIVINGYLSGLSRPEQVVHFFRELLGVPVLSKAVLSQRTTDYQNWVEAFARNHQIPGHGLLERDGPRYAYRLTPKGIPVALLFLFFHKRLCGPLAHSCFHHRPDPAHRPESKLEAAYHKADRAIQDIVELLAAA
jgi:hypothetical protein